METDNPEIIAEARAVFDRREAAIAAKETAVLDASFRPDPRTARFGAAGIPCGIAAIRAFRAAVKPCAPRIRKRASIPTFGRDFACTQLEYERTGTGVLGRETKIMARLPDHGWRVVSAHVPLLAATDPGRTGIG